MSGEWFKGYFVKLFYLNIYLVCICGELFIRNILLDDGRRGIIW